MANKQIKVDIKQAFYDLADELEKECGDWESLPETDNDKALKERILATVIEYIEHKKTQN